jgi:hypothetical protein
MNSRKPLSLFRVLAALMLVSLSALGIFAEIDPDPNSPTPILLSETTSTRALALSESSNLNRLDPTKVESRAFDPNTRVTIFVTNVRLMADEGANAFRVYGSDAAGRQYRFPVVGFTTSPLRGVWAITIQLTDEIGFWPAPTADGDLLLQVTWRGLGSNRVRLGLGQTGGGPADDDGARPTPFGAETTARSTVSAGPQNEADYVGYKWSGDRMRFQEQATFGPNLTQDTRIRRIGIRSWLAEQFSAGYPS